MIEIANKQKLIDRFGFWPSFHDAEIIRIRLEREGSEAPYLEADIYVHHMTKEVDEKGYFVLKNQTLVSFRFCEIDLDYLEDFNHQNALDSLDIVKDEEKNGIFKVEFSPNYGCGIKFTCRAIKILSVAPYEAKK